MHPNFSVNRHRSPTQRSPPLYLKSLVQGVYIPQRKNETHSSNEGSTKEEQTSSERESLVRDSNVIIESNLNFRKTKRDESNFNKFEPQLLLKSKHYNSDKGLMNKIDIKVESKTKKSPEHFYDYFGFKSNSKIENGKFYGKFSDSGDSEKEFKSANSRSSHERNKFLTKKTDKKDEEEKFGKDFVSKQNEITNIKVDLFIKEKSPIKENDKKSFFDNLNMKPEKLIFETVQNKQSGENETKSPAKIYQESRVEPNNYKRTSLSPQNKLNIQISHGVDPCFGNEHLLEGRRSHLNKKNNESPNKIERKEEARLGHIRSRERVNTIIDSKNYQEYSFSKEANFKNTPEPLYSPHKNNKNIVSLSIITINPLTTLPSPSVSFIILEKLSENNSSSIYKCLHPPTGFIYCLKKCTASRSNIDQLIVEHKVAMYMNHPNLVRAYGSFYDKNHLYLLMEFMEERCLFSQTSLQYKHKNFVENQEKVNRFSFKEKPKLHLIEDYQRLTNLNNCTNLNLESIELAKAEKFSYIKQVLEQILEGLSFLHENNIVHRDLKPDNIFISHVKTFLLENCCKIGDFGSCSYTNSQEYIGTLDYAAPEIMLKQKYDKSIDLWSLGCIAFELEVGRPPFYHSDRNETIRKISQIEYDNEIITEQSIRELVCKLLVRSTQGRPNSNEVLMEVKMMNFGDSFGYGLRFGRETGVISPGRMRYERK